jgi:hypothetical protein
MTTRLDETARGVFPISGTPFTPDGALDLDSLDRLVEFYLARRVHGLTVLGIMGEAPKLTAAERAPSCAARSRVWPAECRSSSASRIPTCTHWQRSQTTRWGPAPRA